MRRTVMQLIDEPVAEAGDNEEPVPVILIV